MDNLKSSFDDFFGNDDDNEEGVNKKEVEEAPIALPTISVEHIKSGELGRVTMTESTDDGDGLLDYLPSKIEEVNVISKVNDDSGDFINDYETAITDDNDKEYPDDSLSDDVIGDDIEDFLSEVVDDDEEGSEDEDYYSYFESEEEEDPLKGFNLDVILCDAIDIGASDVHIEPNQPVRFTILSNISTRTEYLVPDGTITQRVQQNILSNVLETDFVENLELDTSYVIKTGRHKGRRLRLSVGKTFGDIFMVFRIISDVVPPPEKLGVSEELLKWTDLPNGLIMLNGPTGTGKALRLDTPLKTPHGFTTIGDVKIGDTLVSSTLENCKVTSVTGVDHHPRLYRIRFTDGQDIYADGNHQWLVGLLNDRIYKENYYNKRDENITLCGRLNALSFAHLNSKESREPKTIEELYDIIIKSDCGDAFPNVGSLADALLFHSILTQPAPKVNHKFTLNEKEEKHYPLAITLRALSVIVRDRFTYDERPLRILTTDEILKEGFVKKRCLNIAIPKPGASNEWIFIKKILKIDPKNKNYGPVRCITVDSKDHSFIVGDGIVTHNSTTLASLLKRIQLTRPQKIITLERPVEFIFGDEPTSLVTQREIGRDARSFRRALDSAMRQAPDIIMVGEVRNREEVNELLRAAETGHLTISTMHTNSAAATINRIKSLYEGEDQLRILASLSDVTRGFANQVLIRSPDGKSRSAVYEVLSVDDEVSELILAGNVKGIRNLQMERKATMEHGLVEAVIEGRCTPDVARGQSAYPRLLEELFEEHGIA